MSAPHYSVASIGRRHPQGIRRVSPICSVHTQQTRRRPPQGPPLNAIALNLAVFCPCGLGSGHSQDLGETTKPREKLAHAVAMSLTWATRRWSWGGLPRTGEQAQSQLWNSHPTCPGKAQASGRSTPVGAITRELLCFCSLPFSHETVAAWWESPKVGPCPQQSPLWADPVAGEYGLLSAVAPRGLL